ncbi:HDOD domain-containing protein [bacterium]|nr:HDOD domain-containing protein [bacterium]
MILGQKCHPSIVVATTAEAIAKYLKIPDPNEAFIPALLHDMGKLILDSFVKADLKNIQSLVAKGESWVRAENMIFGTDHAEIGALLLEKWSFPIEIANSVSWHHDPEYLSSTHNRLQSPNTCVLYARHSRGYNVFLHEPFFVDFLNRAVLEENRSIKTVSGTLLCHFIFNVNYLPRPDPMPLQRCANQAMGFLTTNIAGSPLQSQLVR